MNFAYLVINTGFFKMCFEYVMEHNDSMQNISGPILITPRARIGRKYLPGYASSIIMIRPE